MGETAGGVGHALGRLEAAGARPRALDAPRRLDDASLTHELVPADLQALCSTLAVLAEEARPVWIEGSGSRAGLGNPLRPDTGLVLSTRGLSGVRELDSEDGVLLAGAGTRIDLLRSAAAEAGFELPLDPPETSSTLGGALARGALGLSFPAPRDAVLGMCFAWGEGRRSRCGGRVVKNVTGYDLAKLQVGAFGTLGVIESVWLRLRPQPEERLLLSGPAADRDPSVLLELARLPSARLALRTDALEPEPSRFVLELAGDGPAVAADRARACGRMALEIAPDALRAEVASLHACPPRSGLRVRVGSRVSALPEIASRLRTQGARVFDHPARGHVFADWQALDPERGAALLELARDCARKGAGTVRIEAAPLTLRQTHDVFALDAALARMHRALACRFDPAGILNPGCVVAQS